MQNIPAGFRLVSSTSWTILIKWVLSLTTIAVFTGGTLLVASRAISLGNTDLWLNAGLLFVFCILMVILAWMDWRILVDEVYVNGDKLIIVNYGKIHPIQIGDIERMKFMRGTRGPAFIYLWLKRPGLKDRKIRFIPKRFVMGEGGPRQMLKELERAA